METNGPGSRLLRVARKAITRRTRPEREIAQLYYRAARSLETSWHSGDEGERAAAHDTYRNITHMLDPLEPPA